jgi:hypothetical protein
MRVLVDAAYEQLPSSEVSAFTNTDFGRVISEDTDLLECARLMDVVPRREKALLYLSSFLERSVAPID